MLHIGVICGACKTRDVLATPWCQLNQNIWGGTRPSECLETSQDVQCAATLENQCFQVQSLVIHGQIS